MVFKTFVDNSSLPQEDKDLWLKILPSLDIEQTKIFEDFVDNQEENLKQLTQNLKDKEMAFRNGDQPSLDKILNEEINN